MTPLREALKNKNEYEFDRALCGLSAWGYGNICLMLTKEEQDMVLSWHSGEEFQGLKTYKGFPIFTINKKGDK
jgi:hypothetical protein